MSELRPTSEYSESRIEAAPFIPGDELDLQKSHLPSAEQGRRFAAEARAAIEAAIRREGPPALTPEQLSEQGAREAAMWTKRDIYLRSKRLAQEKGMPAPVDPDESLRLWDQDMGDDARFWADRLNASTAPDNTGVSYEVTNPSR